MRRDGPTRRDHRTGAVPVTEPSSGSRVLRVWRCAFPWVGDSQPPTALVVGDDELMAVVDWGVDKDVVWVKSVGPPRAPHELPEVLEQARQGFLLLDDIYMWSFVPAIWPPEHRRCLEDHSTLYADTFCSDGTRSRKPWTAGNYFDRENDINNYLAEAGLPPRPAGRLWVLKPPARFPDLDSVFKEFTRRIAAEGANFMLSAEVVDIVDRVVQEWVAAGWGAPSQP